MSKKSNLKRTERTVLTASDKIWLKLFHAHLYNYRTLILERTSTFDGDGSVEITNADGVKYRLDGRKWITDHIRYFEEKDDPHYYRMCAKLKEVLDEYDERFGIEKPREY